MRLFQDKAIKAKGMFHSKKMFPKEDQNRLIKKLTPNRKIL